MAEIAEIIEEMQLLSGSCGSELLSTETRNRLVLLTRELIRADASAASEHQRFIDIRSRSLDLHKVQPQLHEAYSGRRVLVTGGTGCIGQALISRLLSLGAGEIVSVSRRVAPSAAVAGATYVTADVCDKAQVEQALQQCRPDIVFHLAAQRDPGLAEQTVIQTVRTNIIGTRNVVEASQQAGVQRFIHASTGKAVRYHTRDVYAASKKIAEWIILQPQSTPMTVGAGRFTHVVDNSIVFSRMTAAAAGGIARIHDPTINFYVQSARESAELLMVAGLNDSDALQILAIRDLGEPIRLLSMALGLFGLSPRIPPIHFTGFDQGYENALYPGLYDPRTASDLSPLINAIEAGSAHERPNVPGVDQFELPLPIDQEVESIVRDLCKHCESGDVRAVRESLEEASKTMAARMFATADSDLISRLRRAAERTGDYWDFSNLAHSDPALR